MGKLADYIQNLIQQESEAARQQAETQLALDKQRQQNTKKALDTIKGLAVSNTQRQVEQTQAQVQVQETATTALRKYLDRVEGAAVANTQRQVQQDQARIQGQQEAETALQKYIKRVTEKPTDELSVAAREERAARRAMNAENAAAGAMAQAGVRPSEEDIARRLQSEEAYRKAGERLEEAGGKANTSMTIGNLAQYGSSLANYLVAEGKQLSINTSQQTLREAQRALLAAGDAETAEKYEEDIQALEALRNERGPVQQALDRGTAWGQEQMAAAKVGRSEAGKFLVDLALQGEQMAVDAALGGAVGARLLPMYMRAAGGAEQSAYAELKEQGQENPDARATLRYGRAVGAVEALTEKMYDGVSGIFGKGAADEVIADFVNRAANDKLGRAALQSFFNFAGEYGEEIASGLIDPALQSIYNGKSIGESWSTLEVSELLYDAFVGGVMGLLGGSAEVMMNYNAPLGEQVDTRPINERVRDTLRDPQALREYAAKYGDLGESKTETGRKLSQIMQQEEKRAKELREIELELKSGKQGSLKDETPNGIKKRNLNAQQKVGLRVARTLAEMGNNIHIFQSENVNGEWVLPENLRAKMGRDGAPNGWYETETGDIWVDLNAGKDGKGTMAYTLAHEITHKIKASSEVSFGALQDFLNGIYGIKGVSVEELAAERVAEAAAKGKALSMDIAMEEVVADSMEAMFTDARVMDKIDALKARNQSLWKTLRDNVRRWARQFDTAYVPTDPDSVEGRYIKAMRDYVDELAAIFAEGTVKAGVSREKGEESGVRNSFAGRESRTANHSLLQQAEQMEQQGSNAETIRQETGWFRGDDKLWRYEIDDSKAWFSDKGDAQFRKMHPEYARYLELWDKMAAGEMTEEDSTEFDKLDETWGRTPGRLYERVQSGAATLADVMEHEELYKAYPDIAKTRVEFVDLPNGVNGEYVQKYDVIRLNKDLRGEHEIMRTLLHEVQHRIQQAEGFASGTSPAYWSRGEAFERGLRKYEDERGRILAHLAKEDYDLYREYTIADMRLGELLDKSRSTDLTAEEEAESDALEEKTDELYRELYGKEWYGRLNFLDRILSRERSEYIEEAVNTLYRNTAGEIEARDTANRRTLDAEGRKNTPPNVGSADVVFAEDGTASLYTDYADDGEPVTVIRTESNAFKNAPRSAYGNIARKIILDRFKGQVLPVSDNDLARITKRSAEEYGFPAKPYDPKSEEYAAKVRASVLLDELLENSVFIEWKEDNKRHPHKSAELGWDYYRTIFIIDGKVFEGKINIANSESERVFYDITDIKEIPGISGKYVAPLARSSSTSGDYENTVPQAQPDVKLNFSLPTGKGAKTGTKKDFPGLPTGKERVRNSERAVSDWVATMQEARQKLNSGNKYSFTTDNGNEFVIRALPQLDGSVTASITKNGEKLISGKYGSKNEAISVLIGEAQQNDGRKLNGMEATWADAGEDPDQLIGTPGGMERAGDRPYSKAEAKPASEKLIEFEDGAAIPEDSFSAAIREAFPNRIDKAQAKEIAEKNDYPKLQRLDGKEPQQVIPYYTFVKAMDRGNYGLITSWDPYQGFGVQFINKEAGIAGFRYFPANELRAVDARYSDPDGNWWKVEDPGEPVRAESADYKEEKAAAQAKVDSFTPGGESEIGFEREEKKAKKPKEKNKLYDPEFTIKAEGDSETMTEKRRLAKEAEYDTLRGWRAKTKAEIGVLERLQKLPGTQLTGAQRAHLADLNESLQAYTDELKTRKAPVQEEGTVKTMPTESAKAATNKLLKLMDIQAGNREAGRTILNGMFRNLVENGKITETEIEEAFSELLELGVSVQEEQSFAGMLYRELKGTKIYVSDKTKADFTDYFDFVRQARSAGLTLVNDTSAPSIDQLTMELTDTWGDMFEIDSAPGDQLRNLVDMMEQGKTKHIPKAEAIAKEAAEARVDAEDVIEEYLSEFRAATKTFVESAKAEIKAKDKAAKEMQEQRSYIERAEEQRRQRKRENDIRDRVMSQMKKLSRMGKKASPAQKAAIEELIGNIDLMAKSISPTGVESLEALKRDYDARKAAAGWESEENPGNWLGDNYAEKKLARLGQKHVKDMSVSELLELGNAVSNMITQIENQDKLVDDERQRKISETAKQMRSELAGARGIAQNRASTKLKEFLSFEQLGGRRVFDMLGGWKDGAWHDLGLALEKGGVDKLAFIQDAYSGIKPWLDKNKTWAKTASGKRAAWIEYEVPCITGAAEDGTPITGTVKFEITPMMRVYLIMASKNKDNLRHIAEGGLVLPDKKAYIKGNKAETYSEHRKVRLSPETVRMIANDATEAERGFAAELEKFMDGTAKNAINSVSMQLDGYERAAVDHYWPINSDKVFTKTDAGREANAATAEGTPNIANERVAGANTPVYLEDASDTFARAVESDAKYYGYAIPVRNFNAVWNYTFRLTGDAQSDALKGQIDKKWTSAANAYLKKIVDDIQAPNGASRDMTSRMLNSLKSAMAGSTLAFNPSVAISQAASYPGAAAVLSQRALLAGLNPAKRADPALIAKYTPVYWSRGDSNADTTMLQGEGMNSDIGQKAPWLFGWIQGMDQLTIRRLWVACDYEVSHKAETKALDGDAHYEAVAELFNKVVHDTQPNYTTFERGQILRSESDLTKALTMFKTVSQQYYGVMFEAQARLQAAKTEAKKSGAGETEQKRLAEAQDNWVKSMSAITAANVMYVMVKALFKGIKGTDDDYKEENGGYSPKSIAKGLGKDFAEVTVGSVMFGDLALAFFKSLATGEKFEAPEISSVEVVEDLANALGDLRDIGKYGEEDTARIIKKTAMQLTTVFKGVPAKNMESWTLAFTRLVAPEAAAKYDSLFRETTRIDLKELKGERLKAGVRTLLDSRFGSDDGTDEIARLYAAGYTDAVPTAIPGDFEWTTSDALGNKTKHEVALTYGTREKYRQAWTKAAELDELLNSKVYQNADDKAKAAMIRGLYDYATQVAREAVSDYEMDSANAKIQEANAAGISTATYLSFYYSVKDIQSDKDANGKSVSGSAAYKKTVALRKMRLSDKETDYLARTIASEACINDYDKVKDYMSFDMWALIYNTYQMTDSKNEKGISVNGLKKKRMEEYLTGMAISEEARKACLGMWYTNYALPTGKEKGAGDTLRAYMGLPTGKEEKKKSAGETLREYMGLPTGKEKNASEFLKNYIRDNA